MRLTKPQIRNPSQFASSSAESSLRTSSFVIDSGFWFRHSGFIIGFLFFSSSILAQTPRDKSAPAGAGTGQERITVDEKTENVIRGALKYLASKQNTNGSWTASDGERQEVAMTGYTLITFLSAGHLPDEGEH